MTTTLHLVRHGETLWHAENRYAGSTDIGLTDRGRDQADQLARWAAGQNIAEIYSSDLSRALLTATPAAAALGLQVTVDPRFREVDFGGGEGLTETEMSREFPHARARFVANPATVALPGGERGVDALLRAHSALGEITEAAPDASVLIVMHSTLMRLVICGVLGITPDRYRVVLPRVPNVAITTLCVEQDSWSLLELNTPSSA